MLCSRGASEWSFQEEKRRSERDFSAFTPGSQGRSSTHFLICFFKKIPALLTFTHSYFWNLCRSRGVEGGAGQPQSAVAVRPVLTAAWLPLQPGALVAASARIPGQGPAALAVVRGLEGTRPEVTRRALVSPQAPHHKEDAHEHRGTLAEHGWVE